MIEIQVWKIDGEIVYSMAELMSCEIMGTLGMNYNESLGNYEPIYGKREFRSFLICGNIVPCFTFKHIYAGLGGSMQFRNVRFDDSLGGTEQSMDAYVIVSLGYSWKFVQVGLYMDDFVQRMGIQFKLNLLTIKRNIASKRRINSIE